jgi:hypothetical protein
VSSDASTSATVVFYNAGPKGFVNAQFGGPLSASLSGVLPNGTIWGIAAPATSAIFTRESEFSFATSANFESSGFSFNGTDLGHGKIKYVVTIDTPGLGVTGTVTLEADAPARYPCGLDRPGQVEEAFPGVFWDTPIPDAVSEVDLRVNGTKVSFKGVGYHDKNWGEVPFVSTLAWTYWGHARLGPYALTWSQAQDSAGVEHYSGYVAKDGKVLVSSCASESVVVRPWGANSEFPPKIGTGVAQGLEVLFDLDDGRTFWANLTTTNVAVNETVYTRTLGTGTGGLGGFNQETYKGAALFESFKLTQ